MTTSRLLAVWGQLTNWRKGEMRYRLRSLAPRMIRLHENLNCRSSHNQSYFARRHWSHTRMNTSVLCRMPLDKWVKCEYLLQIRRSDERVEEHALLLRIGEDGRSEEGEVEHVDGREQKVLRRSSLEYFFISRHHQCWKDSINVQKRSERSWAVRRVYL